ncbi:girdin-like isoform X3 [Apostichopus japonicus]|uniref:girdin-like isoform X3 n=1 Tax=Stichopus japonicus TaxID=307972 RepID=UPI003AB67CEA
MNAEGPLEEFMAHPLVLWIQTFKKGELDYMELVDGTFLNNVMNQISPRCSSSKVHQDVGNDVNLKIQNLSNLLKSIKLFYLDVLDQIVVMKLPDILTIAKDPMEDTAVQELQRLLLLMLGCAVQCDQKEMFIERIKQLDLDVQQAIVVHIQEVTDNTENVFNLHWGELPSDQFEGIFKTVFNQVKSLATERDEYSKIIIELSQEKPDQSLPYAPSPVSPVPSQDKHRQVTIDLAETKSKLRRLRQEVEEKNEVILEYKEEAEKINVTLQQLRQENLELTQDARAARAYRDELDVYKEMALKSRQLEVEVTKYKEKMNEMDYLSKRVEELRDDNQLLSETKTLLEEQLETAQGKLEHAREVESENISLQEQVKALEGTQDEDRKRMQQLTEEVSSLRLAHNQSISESQSLGLELEQAKNESTPGNNSFLSEYNASASTQALKLEKEVQSLRKELQRMNQQNKKYQESSTKDMKSALELEQMIKQLKEEKSQAEESALIATETLKGNQAEWEAEKEQYDTTMESLRERNQKDMNQRIKDVEEENKRLNENVRQAQTRITKLELNNKQLQKTCGKLKEKVERTDVVEKHNLELENEKETMKRKIEMLTLMCEKFDEVERTNTELEVENSKYEKTVESLTSKVQRYEQVESEFVKVKANESKLQRSLGAMKDAATRITTLEMEKEELDRRNRQLQKNIDNLKATQERLSQLEVENVRLDTDNKRLEKSVSMGKEKYSKLEKENQTLETEIQKLKKTIDSLKLSNKKAEEIEKDLRNVEVEHSNLETEVKKLEKENKRLKQSLESRETLVDESNAKVTSLEQEIKMLQRTVSKSKDAELRSKEYEKENKELLKQATIEKKTMSTLREEFVNEKIQRQQLENEQERLTSELEKLGLDREKLLHQELNQDETRYKALESKMDEALKKNLEIKEEKIKNLETRWKESVSRNQVLSEDLNQVKRDYERLQNQLAEERSKAGSKTKEDKKVKRTDSDRQSTKEVMKMQDHLVSVERTNATLQSEANNLKDQIQVLRDQCESKTTEVQSYQSKMETLQAESTNAKLTYAKLQVENKTLESQNMSLQSRIATEVADFEILRERYDELDSNHEALLSDHSNILQLHESLTDDYDALLEEHNNVKLLYRDVKADHQDLASKSAALERRCKEAEKSSSASKKREEVNKGPRLQAEYDSLQRSHSRLNQEYNEREDGMKTVKTQYRSLQLEHTSLQGELAEARDQYQSIEVERAKLEHKCEMLMQLNSNLEDENHKLMEQLAQSMAQNSELLVNTLESKEFHHEEQRQLEDQLHNLRRQKEKLEEKIMDQYKNYTSPHKKSKGGLNLNFMKKIYKSNKTKDKRKKMEQDLSVQPDPLGETSSTGSGVESWEGSNADNSRKSDDIQDKTPTWDLSPSSANRINNSKQHRMSMPPSVLAGHIDAANREYYSMSTEDLRMPREALRKSSMAPALSTPALNDDEVFDSDQEGGMDDSLSRYVKKSGRPADKVARKGSSVGMLSRIKSRSREILTDLRANSVENLAEESSGSGQKQLYQQPDLLPSVDQQTDAQLTSDTSNPIQDRVEAATEIPLTSAMYVDDLNSNISQDIQFEFPDEVLLQSTDNHYTTLGYSPRPFKQNTTETDGAQPVVRRNNGDTKGDNTKRKERPKSAADLSSKRKPVDSEMDMQNPSQVRRLSAKLEKLQSSSSPGSTTPTKTSPKTPSPTNQSEKEEPGDQTPGDQTPGDGKGEKEKKKNSIWYEYGCV